MIFGLPSANLVEERSGDAGKQRLVARYLEVQQKIAARPVTWGSNEHVAMADAADALREAGYWNDPDVQEILRLQDLALPGLKDKARTLVQQMESGDAGARQTAVAMAQRLVEWRADALAHLGPLLRGFVRVTTGVDPGESAAGAAAIATAAAEVESLVSRDPYWRSVAADFASLYGPALRPLPVWARSHLGVEI